MKLKFQSIVALASFEMPLLANSVKALSTYEDRGEKIVPF